MDGNNITPKPKYKFQNLNVYNYNPCSTISNLAFCMIKFTVVGKFANLYSGLKANELFLTTNKPISKNCFPLQ